MFLNSTTPLKCHNTYEIQEVIYIINHLQHLQMWLDEYREHDIGFIFYWCGLCLYCWTLRHSLIEMSKQQTKHYVIFRLCYLNSFNKWQQHWDLQIQNELHCLYWAGQSYISDSFQSLSSTAPLSIHRSVKSSCPLLNLFKYTPFCFACSWLLSLFANMKSSIKPKVHNISHHHQRRTDLWPYVTCTKNLMTIRLVIPGTLTDRHRDSSLLFCSVL